MRSNKGIATTTLVIVVAFILFCIGSLAILNNEWLSNSMQPKLGESEEQIVGDKVAAKLFPVTVNRPETPRAETGQFHADGQPVTVACSVCHSVRPPNADNKSADDLNEFHGGLAFSHGSIACLSCHNPDDYDTLKLANGQAVGFPDVMTLCAQCHGQQMRDYEHGAHGGMNGYWDLKRGPRSRKNCIDCHDPHAPKFPLMKPTFKPRDRFLEPQHDNGHGHD